jgi:hypothetical protein
MNKGKTADACRDQRRGNRPPKKAPPQPTKLPAPPPLVRTAVFKKVPLSVRRRLDRALLLRPEGCATLEAIADNFKLHEKLGISRAALRTYARKLEKMVEPVFAGHLLATILGCLPETYTRQLTAGSQVLLLSKAAKALTQDDAKLEVPDLAKLSGLLAARTDRSTVTDYQKKGYTNKKVRPPGPTNGNPAAGDRQILNEAIQTVYGITWPPSPQRRPEPADRPEQAIAK